MAVFTQVKITCSKQKRRSGQPVLPVTRRYETGRITDTVYDYSLLSQTALHNLYHRLQGFFFVHSLADKFDLVPVFDTGSQNA